MTEEQAKAWLAIEGWRAVGRKEPGEYWYGFINPKGLLVCIHWSQGYIHKEVQPTSWYIHAMPRYAGDEAPAFAAYIQRNGL